MKTEARDRLGHTLDGRYRIERVLGAGGLGTVYRAHDLRLERPVAIKMLHAELLASPDLRRRFDLEVKTLSRLAHPHIVTLTDSGVLGDGVGYLVMELLEGESLEDKLRGGRVLPPAEAIEIARQMLLGVAEAHDKGVLHRDLKPANVFLLPLAQGVHVKLLDFGLAKVRSDVPSNPGAAPGVTAEGLVVGTPTYMAPEQGTGQPITASADLYAIGILLFEMLAGAPPFRSQQRLDVIRAHLVQPVPELDAICPTLRPSDALRAFVRRALAKHHTQRFESARSMLRALEALPQPAAEHDEQARVAGSPAKVHAAARAVHEKTMIVTSGELQEVVSAPRRSRRSNASRLAIAALAGLAALASVVGATWVITRRRAPRPEPTPVAPAEPSVVEREEVAPPEDGGTASLSFGGSVPTELGPARRTIVRGRSLSDAQARAVEAYFGAHPEDARAPLLLARSARLRGRWAAMVSHYVAAHAVDPSAASFAPMLSDLVRAVEDDEASRAASDAIARIYGERAIAAVSARAAELSAGPARTRLARLEARLSRARTTARE